MKNTSLFTRLLIGNIVLVAIILLVGGVFAQRLLIRHENSRSEQRQRDLLVMAVESLAKLDSLSAEKIQQHCTSLPLPKDMRLTVIAPDGTVLGDTQHNPDEMVLHNTPDRPEVMAALDNRFGQDRRSSETVGIEFRYFTLPVHSDSQPDNVKAVCRLATKAQSVEQDQQFIYNILISSAILMLVVAILLAWLINWIWYRPLRQITAEASRIASGDLDEKPLIEGARELRQLSKALDNMRRTVSSQILVIHNQRERLQTILAHLADAIVATDEEGRIVFMNPTATEFFDPTEDPMGHPLQDVVRQPQILDICAEAMESRQPIRRQVEADLASRRYILQIDVEPTTPRSEFSETGTTAVETPGERKDVAMLLVINDLTNSIRVGQMKTDFVANASHELRTPLATLRAAVEILLETDTDNPESIHRIVTMIDRHVSRLEEMIEDLLDLHLVENTSMEIGTDEIFIEDLLQWTRSHYAEKAQARKIEFSVEGHPLKVRFELSRKHLKLISRNLIDNAIKFTPPEGKVDIRYTVENGYLVMAVKDTGCGIPPEEQPKVFDRFYQVDQSRQGDSRQRGTGLGLAIVKHAVERLDGDITLHSRMDSGTTVTIHVPVKVVSS